MKFSRRSMILGGSAILAGYASAPHSPIPSAQAAELLPELPPVKEALEPVWDPQGLIRPELLERARAAMDTHSRAITQRDRLYIVDFQKFSAEPRLFEVDIATGETHAFLTTHGRGSDPRHSGYAQQFSNRQDSHMSSVGAYATGGASWGRQHGPNVLLDGLEPTNDRARQRAIIVHSADYAEKSIIRSQGKLGRSYGCFACSHADLQTLRQRMGKGRLLLAMS